MKHAHTAGPFYARKMVDSSLWLIRTENDAIIAADVYPVDGPLLALAPTAPHDCDIPGCPGAENKRKLEAFGRLWSALDSIAEKAELLRENAHAEGHSWEADDAEGIRNQARAASAKAQDAKVGGVE